MPAMKLYYDPASTVCRPIMLLAAEAGIELEYVHVCLYEGEHLKDEFLAINPNGAVPILVDGDFRLAECSAILKYLADKVGSPAYPSELKARARVNEAMDWFNTGFYKDFGYGLVYSQVLPKYAADAEHAGKVVALSAPKADRWLRVLDARLAQTPGAFVAGPAVTIADYFGACLVSLGDLIGFDLFPYPHVQAWMNAVQALPAWPEVNAAFFGWRSTMQEQAKLTA
jgi:glutathione S-transferase